jgi:lipopolysaccharide exporter
LPRLRRSGWLPTWTRHWARDSALLLVSQAAAVIATSVLAIVLARSLGPSDWGIFAGLLGLSVAFSAIVSFGVAAWLLRELSRLWSADHAVPEETRSSAGELVGGATLLTASLAVPLIAGTLVVAVVAQFDLTVTVALLGLMGYAALSALSDGLEAFFRSRRQLRPVVAALLLEKTLLLGLVAGVVLLGLGVAAVATTYAIAGAARLAFDGVNILASDHLTLRSPGFAGLSRTVRGAVPFALNAASVNIIPRFDTVILVALSATAAGYYAIGDRVIGPAIMIPWVMSTALYPFLTREDERSRAAWKILAAFVLAGASLAVVGVALSPVLVPLIFGTAYEPAIEVVQVMLLGLPFIYGTNALLVHLYTRGRERPMLFVTISVSLVGTGAIVAGQLALGPTGAGGGYLVRQSLLLTGLLAVGLLRPSIRRADRTRSLEYEAARISDER